MNKYPNYIVLATDPIDLNDHLFKDGYYQQCEWTIFTGVTGLEQADFFAKRLREHFKEVQVRTVGELTDTYRKVNA